MLLDQWIDVTKRVLVRDASDPFLPTVANPTTREVRTMEGIPPDVPHTQALQEWIARLNWAECFFAVAQPDGAIIVGHIGRHAPSFAIIQNDGPEWQSASCGQPKWWRT